MFSVCSFTLKANSAISRSASGSNSRRTPSVSSSAEYCLVSDDLGSVRMRRKSSTVSDLQFDANGEAALQFGDEVAGLGDVEGAGGDEQDVIGAHHAVARVHGGAFNDGENVALHAFARNVGAVAALAAGDLVDLIEKDDAAGSRRALRLRGSPGPCR